MCTLDSEKAVCARCDLGENVDFEPIKYNDKEGLCKNEKVKLYLTIVFFIVI